MRFLCLVPLCVQNHFGLSKSFWSSTNHFELAQFVFVGSTLFWTGPNYKNIPEKSNLSMTKRIWTQPKSFGPIEGQDINLQLPIYDRIKA